MIGLGIIIFSLTSILEMKCGEFPDGNHKKSSWRILFNPMSEYINRHGQQELHENFDEFKRQHGYKYKDEHEHRHRLKIFHHNVRYINTRNRAGLTYRMKINRFADRTVKELQSKSFKKI